jgi:uncharacterized membrane protein YjjP (DUF1212 family)
MPQAAATHRAMDAGETAMTAEQRANLVLSVARVLFINGQATEQTVNAAARLGRALGLSIAIMPRWGELALEGEEQGREITGRVAADPVGVDMDRVAAAMRTIEDMVAERVTPEAAMPVIARIAQSPPAATWLFALAAAAGAVALAVIFGLRHGAGAALIFVSAGGGGMLRRWLGRISPNLLLQPFCASMLAGVVGALAVRYHLSSSLRLVAVCPCMVLVPGPHFLNSALDLINGRIALGAARLMYAGLIVAAISIGLLVGLGVLGVSLPTDPIGRAVPLWQDVIAAGVAVAAYSVFFSSPPRMLAWPVAVGMAAHALRWGALNRLGFGVAGGALAACVAVALVLTPVSRRTHMPFAAIGFAAVVSMIPGVYLFRMASGLLRIAEEPHPGVALLGATAADGLQATIVILAMSIGLIVPKLVIDHIADRRARPGA